MARTALLSPGFDVYFVFACWDQQSNVLEVLVPQGYTSNPPPDLITHEAQICWAARSFHLFYIFAPSYYSHFISCTFRCVLFCNCVYPVLVIHCTCIYIFITQKEKKTTLHCKKTSTITVPAVSFVFTWLDSCTCRDTIIANWSLDSHVIPAL